MTDIMLTLPLPMDLLHAKITKANLQMDDVIVLCMTLLVLIVNFTDGRLWNKADSHSYILDERRQEKLSGFKRKEEGKIRDVGEYLLQDDISIAVFWGSQSGTAEDLSRRLAKDLHDRFDVKASAVDISQFVPRSFTALPKKIVSIFVFSTYGQGDPPDGAAEFCKWAKEDNSRLSNLQYAALGLGDSDYKDFNLVIDTLDEAISRRDATAIMPVARADASHGGTETHFMMFREHLFAKLRNDFGFQEHAATYKPAISIAYDTIPTSLYIGAPFPSESRIQAVPIKVCKDLCPGSLRHRIHLELDFSSYYGTQYKTGDHVEVWPMNPEREVDRLLEVLALDNERHKPISIHSVDRTVKCGLPSPTTLQALFTHYLAICAPVSRDTIQALTRFSTAHDKDSYLDQLAVDQDTYANFSRKGYTLGELLEMTLSSDVESNHIPVSWVLERMPVLTPRVYSISSSSVVQPRRVAITVAVASNGHRMATPSRGFGVASNYMLALQRSLEVKSGKSGLHPYGLTFALEGPERLLSGGKLNVAVKRSKFRLPLAHACPIVMVANGTGVAPFRAFIQERARLKSTGIDIGPTKLFFGCRNVDEDFLYSEEFLELKEALKDTFEIITAFSRQESKPNGERMYVQDKFAVRVEEMCELLTESNCCFYLCGSASMAREVASMLGEALKLNNGWDDARLRMYMGRMKAQRRWQEDVWN